MKKLLLIFSIIISISASAQTEPVKYYGGIYDKLMYFNFVLHNEDTCYFIVEASSNGIDYIEIFCDSMRPVPVPISHSVKLPTNATEMFVKITVQTKNKTTYFQPQPFLTGKYTYVTDVAIMKTNPRTIYGKF